MRGIVGPGGLRMKRIVVLGAGFAGLWSAVGAARKLAERNISREEISVTVVNRDRWHTIRVRNYEPDLSDVRVPLDDVLAPIGVDLVVGEVTGLDPADHQIACRTADGAITLPYDQAFISRGWPTARMRPDAPRRSLSAAG